MKLDSLVRRIKKDWNVDKYPEDWSFVMEGDEKLEAKATPEFLKDHRGLIFNNSKEVNKIFLTCFPSNYVLREIAKKNKDVLLISHHPFDWNGNEMGFIRYGDKEYRLMEDRGISVMFMHVPWDAVRNDKDRVSTAWGSAKKLNMNVKGKFQEYHGATVSLYGTLPVKTMDNLEKYIKNRLGNKKLNVFRYGSEEVGLVGFVPGGGNGPQEIEEAHEVGVNTYITGCTNKCKHPYSVAKSKEFLDLAKEYKINVIGASHYLTEKWAMQQSVPYFRKFKMPVKFIEDFDQMKVLD